jgi:hypothetical protein
LGGLHHQWFEFEYPQGDRSPRRERHARPPQAQEKSNLRKLFIAAEPGSILVGRAVEFCRRWPNQREVKVRGIHFIQEDAPVQIGQALETFIRDL